MLLNKYNIYGFDIQGNHLNGTRFDNFGFDANGIHKDTKELINPEGFTRDGTYGVGKKVGWSDKDGYDFLGFDVHGLTKDGKTTNSRGFLADKKHENGTYFNNKGEDRRGVPKKYSGINPGLTKILQLILVLVVVIPLVLAIWKLINL